MACYLTLCEKLYKVEGEILALVSQMKAFVSEIFYHNQPLLPIITKTYMSACGLVKDFKFPIIPQYESLGGNFLLY